MNKSILDLTEKQYTELKKAYQNAIIDNEDEFQIWGQPVLRTFAKYWLQALDQKRKAQGLPLHNQHEHDCPNGTKHIWIAKTKQPLACPKCKQYIRYK